MRCGVLVGGAAGLLGLVAALDGNVQQGISGWLDSLSCHVHTERTERMACVSAWVMEDWYHAVGRGLHKRV